MLKRHGHGNDKRGVSATCEGECAMICPACPHPGVNMVTPTDANKNYVNRLFLGVDANFQLVQLEVSNEKCNPGLNHGFAYFVEQTAFREHLIHFRNKLPAETNTCHNHDAIKLTALQGKGTAASGVGAVVCARHDMRRPCSMADLHKGEDYLHMDYVVLKCLQKEMPDDIVISYNIACQWSVNFWLHAHTYREGFILHQVPEWITFLVPKFHPAAHIEKC
ncbi:hypothetical protein IW262DRAFT_1447679 [Armillaria fumosa]|nr:hypothetical protein IW262DRAFT_1447679 [Armillaria fumosa]